LHCFYKDWKETIAIFIKPQLLSFNKVKA